MPDFELEKAARRGGFNMICGVDEAGRGPLAGPVCAAAVILPEDTVIEGLNDSKKISEKKREQLFEIIKEKAVAYAIAFGTVEEIEEFNILEATFIAMNRAIEGLSVKAEHALIDGNKEPRGAKIPCTPIVKGDAKSMSIAAASILAKVSRDRVMEEMDAMYPQYNFKKHKGYPTDLHRDLVKEYGPSPVHRRTFLTKILGDK